MPVTSPTEAASTAALIAQSLKKGDAVLFRQSEAGPLYKGVFIRVDGGSFNVRYRGAFGITTGWFLTQGIVTSDV